MDSIDFFGISSAAIFALGSFLTLTRRPPCRRQRSLSQLATPKPYRIGKKSSLMQRCHRNRVEHGVNLAKGSLTMFLQVDNSVSSSWTFVLLPYAIW
jgi:hypothetical protein